MAIQVGGTTVIDDSRVLSNVTGLKTINSTSILGSGNIAAGSSTTYGAVGTYVWGYFSGTGIADGSTKAGSSIYPAGDFYYLTSLAGDSGSASFIHTQGGSALSGTWRAMGRTMGSSTNTFTRFTLFVRIS